MKCELEKRELDLKHHVTEQLEWEPNLDAAPIGVTCGDGVVTLTGSVSSYAEKLNAERAVKRVIGVRALVSELKVQPGPAGERTDTDIARAVVQALQWDVAVPHEKITVQVVDGRVTLEGVVDLPFQRVAAERAVSNLAGVKDVKNLITLKRSVWSETSRLGSRQRSAELPSSTQERSRWTRTMAR